MLKLAKYQDGPEIFHSIQGEGKSTGQPFVFIRTSLCNLHCIWCDTDYTWNWRGTEYYHEKDDDPRYEKYVKEDHILEMETPEIVDLVRSFNCPNVIFTGGEPMLQQRPLMELAAVLKAQGITWMEVETNGTFLPKDGFDQFINQYNVSPKLSNSNNSEKLREKPAVLLHFAQSSKAHFKFVINAEQDLDEVATLQERYKIPAAKIYLMPEGRDAETLRSRQQWLIEVCKARGYNFTDRLHIHIYGNKRGI